LKSITWDFEGLLNKIQLKEFINLLKCYDFISLQESWITNSDDIEVFLTPIQFIAMTQNHQLEEDDQWVVLQY
jgi:hypothetical protein